MGSPLALTAAVLFYFGWVRVTVEAAELGYDAAVLDLTTTDYVVKSIRVLFMPLLILLVLTLLLIRLHQALVRRAADEQAGARRRRNKLHPRRLRPDPGAVPQGQRANAPSSGAAPPRWSRMASWLVRVLAWSWVGWLVLGVGLLASGRPPDGLTVPLCLTGALLCALYAERLRAEALGGTRWSLPVRAVVLILISMVIFLDTERFARIVGEGNAAQVVNGERKLAYVTVYSKHSLELGYAGAQEQRLSGAEGAYQFRYTGLRLLQRSGERYFLISGTWQPLRGPVIVLRDGDGVRLEFYRK